MTGNPGILESSVLGSSGLFSCDFAIGKDVLGRRGFFFLLGLSEQLQCCL